MATLVCDESDGDFLLQEDDTSDGYQESLSQRAQPQDDDDYDDDISGVEEEEEGDEDELQQSKGDESSMVDDDDDAELQTGICGTNDAQLDLDEMFHEMLQKEARLPLRSTRVWRDPHHQRAVLVEWISQLGESQYFGLSPGTIHLTVDLLDSIHADFAPERLPLAAVACVLIAAKHEETEERVPTLSELDRATGGRYTVEIIKKMEQLVLNRLGWELMRSTACIFLTNFVGRGACTIRMDEDLFEGQPVAFERVLALEGYLKRYASFFSDVCLQDPGLSLEQYSLLAAACLLCARKALHVSPIWSDHLRKITTLGVETVQPCADRVWAVYSRIFLNQT